jgi:hypothetical protein
MSIPGVGLKGLKRSPTYVVSSLWRGSPPYGCQHKFNGLIIMKKGKMQKIFKQSALEVIKTELYNNNYERDYAISANFLMRIYALKRHYNIMRLMILISTGVGILASFITYLIIM